MTVRFRPVQSSLSVTAACGGAQAVAQLTSEGYSDAMMRIRRFAALHYKGQSYELVVPVNDGPISAETLTDLEEAFNVEHERTYGHRASSDEPVELVSIQVLGLGVRQDGGVPDRVISSRAEPEAGPPRDVYFGRPHGWLETPILRRSDLTSAHVGPLIIEEYDATCVVAPGAKAQLDQSGNIAIDMT